MHIQIYSPAIGINSRKEKKQPSQNNKFPPNTWFDKECKAAKRRIKRDTKQLKNDPNNEEIQMSFWSERRVYIALIRKKKREAVALLQWN